MDAPVRAIAARAGIGIGTVYRHFPTRADLVIAVYRHQVDSCAEAGPVLLASASSPHAALKQWIDLFVDFLVTKHGLTEALQSDSARFESLHAYFLDRMVPACAALLEAAVQAGEAPADVTAYSLMRGIGNLCIGADSHYNARRLVDLLAIRTKAGGRHVKHPRAADPRRRRGHRRVHRRLRGEAARDRRRCRARGRRMLRGQGARAGSARWRRPAICPSGSSTS
ncbi:regulatory protein, tetR family [Sinosporangium album]|uniref:Regulatory protein, tetR family n=1 Tax=Sinosporangium album TaxID=504805 RepID=A0A1G7WRW1_9ACTN|nr:regulatory protein, tetR family [Sinosporangium album]